jgi:four helix bundle protein
MQSEENGKRKFDLEPRLVQFAASIIELAEKLPSTIGAKHLAGQIVRSGTSPALNYGEAQAAESRQDFIHKMKICLKELRECLITIKIIQRKRYLAEAEIAPMLNENNQLVAIFVKSLNTTDRNNPNNKTD